MKSIINLKEVLKVKINKMDLYRFFQEEKDRFIESFIDTKIDRDEDIEYDEKSQFEVYLKDISGMRSSAKYREYCKKDISCVSKWKRYRFFFLRFNEWYKCSNNKKDNN